MLVIVKLTIIDLGVFPVGLFSDCQARGELPMNTIRCPECDEPLAEVANYCPLCGRSRTSSWHRSDDQWLEKRRSATWRKEVALSPNRVNPPPLPPRPVRSRPPMWNTWRRIRYRLSLTIVVWISIIAFLISGSVFGIVATRGSSVSAHAQELALQVTPDNVAVGGTVILDGEHFNPYGKIALTRDTSIPIQDTANATLIDADHNGNFTDTLVVTPDWGDGLHTINAEDALAHKLASFSIMVTGHATSLRPGHLRVSVDTLDLGSSNQATNTTKMLTLTNIGGGPITWQANSSQSWLVLSPSSGTFASGYSAQVMVAIDRSKLDPGSYHAQINIFSTAGNSTIPVTAVVTALVAGNSAVLQTNLALLSFTAIDGGPSPSAQTITVSNPGLSPLQWQAISSANWLFASPQSAIIDPSGNLPVTISVNSHLLLPGTYNGTITLSTQGSAAVVSSPQTIFVTVTIMPQCPLQATPGQLNFASIYQQGAPPTKAISIGTSQGCSVIGGWQATSTANWLTIGATHGPIPAHLSVGINVSHLLPGVYTGTIMFSSSAGTQTLPVTFTLGHAPIPLVTTAPASISFDEVTGKFSPALQEVSITNSGNTGPLRWYATAAGGNWLSVNPTAGTLATHQTTSFTIAASVASTSGPGTYNGTVTIAGVDSFGHPALGSPQVIPISLLVKPACSFTVAAGNLNFTGISGQTIPIKQQIALQVGSSCANPLDWTVATAGGSNWLAAAVVNGTATPALNVSVDLATLKAANYSGTVTITAHDSVTKQEVGVPQVIPIALSVQSACTLQNPSVTAETFDTQAGSNPVPQTFTIAVTGTCAGAVTIAPSILFKTGTRWLSIAPDTTAITSGNSATFTVTVTPAGLAAGQYDATIQFSAANSGIAMTDLPQGIAVKLIVEVVTQPVLGTPTPTASPLPTATPTPVPIATPIPSPTPVRLPTPIVMLTPTVTTKT
jgi:hypothetical protein